MGVSKNRGTPKSSILTGFSSINHPFWGTSIFGNTDIMEEILSEPFFQETPVDMAAGGVFRSTCHVLVVLSFSNGQSLRLLKHSQFITSFMGTGTRPNPTFTPKEIAGLMIRDYENPLVSLNMALFLGGGWPWGGPLRLP